MFVKKLPQSVTAREDRSFVNLGKIFNEITKCKQSCHDYSLYIFLMLPEFHCLTENRAVNKRENKCCPHGAYILLMRETNKIKQFNFMVSYDEC